MLVSAGASAAASANVRAPGTSVASQAAAVPSSNAQAPPGMRSGSATCAKYVVKITPSGKSAINGIANVRTAKSIAMNDTAMPDNVDSKAAHGVLRRTQSTSGAATSSIAPHKKHAANPT